jgi:hypothetical protein
MQEHARRGRAQEVLPRVLQIGAGLPVAAERDDRDDRDRGDDEGERHGHDDAAAPPPDRQAVSHCLALLVEPGTAAAAADVDIGVDGCMGRRGRRAVR